MADRKESNEFSEGYIKFNFKLNNGDPPSPEKLVKLNEWRQRLYRLGIIGAYPNGVGFGNISVKDGKYFIVSGSATGRLKELKPEHYVTVTGYSFERNFVECTGKVDPSSESMTHAALYEAGAGAAIHVHAMMPWKELMGKVPTTKPNVPYGTPEMAYEMLRLLRETSIRKQRMIVMAGHKEGMIAFGRNLDEAGQVIMKKVVPLLPDKGIIKNRKS